MFHLINSKQTEYLTFLYPVFKTENELILKRFYVPSFKQ